MAKPILREFNNCIFCGGSPTNWEHVWPRWSHRYLPKGKKKWFALHAKEHRDRTDFEFVKHPGDPHDWQVKCVDEQCNNGWMREELENKVRPIMIPLITGDQTPRFLTKKEQRILSAWIALKVMVQEFAPRAHTISHHSQRSKLWKKQKAPESTWRIWIAQYDGANSNNLWAAHPMLILPNAVAGRRKNLTATHFNTQAVTYVIGKLLIHIIRSPYKRLIREWRIDPSVALKLERIWPPTGYDPRWPIKPLTEVEATYLTWAFRAFVKGDRR